ncbi:MAG: glutathione S-transferase family protein [Deltaproteobacteria bacterium]|nr:glutathione S-transferase family protein [Deltaproteobacteria bacterium]
MATLFHFADCPFCFRVRAFLAEREVDYASNLCDREAPPPELHALTPLGKLPVWVTDKGRPIFGSRTITRFVDALAPGPALMPADPLQAARVAMAEDLVDEALLPALIRLDREIAGKTSDQWNLKAYRAETAVIGKMLDLFEQLLGGRPWLVGDGLTPADLALAQPLTILERYGLDLSGQPGLADLAERLAKRSSVLAARRPARAGHHRPPASPGMAGIPTATPVEAP